MHFRWGPEEDEAVCPEPNDVKITSRPRGRPAAGLTSLFPAVSSFIPSPPLVQLALATAPASVNARSPPSAAIWPDLPY